MFTRRLQSILILTLLAATCAKPDSTKESPPRPEKRQVEFHNGDGWIASNLDLALKWLEGLRNEIKEERWEAAQLSLVQFRRATTSLPKPKLSSPHVSLALLDLFDLYSYQLEEAINSRIQHEALFASNQLVNIVGDLIFSIQSNRGIEVRHEMRRLVFLERELHYWHERENLRMLKTRTERLIEAWDDLRAVIYDHKGAEVAAHLDEICEKLKETETLDDYAILSEELSDAVAGLESVLPEIP